MKVIFTKMKVFCIIIMLLHIHSNINLLYAQNQRIHGKVNDLDGNPVNGTVRYSGSTSVLTNGVFSITPKRFPDTIRINALGFISVTRIVYAPGELSVRMTPSITQMQEVVVNTGYQELSPNEINGSVALITSDQIQARTTGNILERIQGQSSGLTVLVGKRETADGGSGVLIRGLGTLHGPIEPLIVLDGFIYDGNINNIDPNTVADVTLLKDASASSIWGARAGNGVIVITTKKGIYNQRMRVSFNSDYSIQGFPKLMEEYRVGAKTHIDLEKFLFEQGFFDQQLKNTPYRGQTPIVDLLDRHRNGLISQSEYESELAFWSKQDSRKNYLNEFYNLGSTQNYGIQLDGGSERNSYMLGASFQKRKDNLSNFNRRLNLRFNNQYKVLESLSLATNIHLTNNSSSAGKSAYGLFRPGGRTVDYLAFRDDLGIPLSIDQTYRGSYTDSVGEGILLDWKYYPSEEYKYVNSNNDRLDLFSTVTLNYIAKPWLNLTGSFQYQIQNSEQIAHIEEESYLARDLINQYTQYNPLTKVISYVVPIGGIYSSTDASINSFAWRGQANFKEQIGAHRINGILGVELRGSGTRSKANAKMYGYQEDPLSYAVVDLQTRFPHFITGQMSQIGAGSTELTRTNYRFVSVYGNLAYTFLNKYILTGSARRDGSNLFGVNTNDRWKPLWSAGVGWDISNESFYRERYISNLKMVFTYGRSGNVDMTKTALPIGSRSTHRETGFRVSRISAINNPELRWEQLDQLNLRIEGRSKNQKIQGSIGLFKKTGTDLYGDAPYDFTGWGVSRTLVRNVASMQGYGLELDMHITYLQLGDFKWHGSTFVNWNENKTTEYYVSSTNTDISRLLGDGNSINPIIGKPLYAIAGRKWAGLDEHGNPMGYLNGIPSTNYQEIFKEGRMVGDNIHYMGSALPRYYGSLINNLSFGPFHLSLNVNFHFGYFIRKNTYNSSAINNSIVHRDFLDRWQKPGDEFVTHVPSFLYPASQDRDSFYTTSEVNVIPGDHIRLGYINLKYSHDTSQWRSPFKYLDVKAGIENGKLLWKKNKAGVDPNFINGDQTGMIWSFGINAQF